MPAALVLAIHKCADHKFAREFHQYITIEFQNLRLTLKVSQMRCRLGTKL